MELFLVKPDKELAALQLIGAYLLVTNNVVSKTGQQLLTIENSVNKAGAKCAILSVSSPPKRFNFDRLFCESGDDGGEREEENREVWDCGQIGTDPS